MSEPARQAPGRPLDHDVTTAIVDAIVHIAVAHGLSELTISAVVEQAETTRPAFYRRFSNLDQALVHVLTSRFAHIGTPDTGSLLEDLITLQRAEITMLNDPLFRAVLPYLAYRIGSRPLSMSHLGEQFVTPRRAHVVEVLNNAVQRGELSAEPNVELVCNVLIGVLIPTAFFPNGRELVERDAVHSAELAAVAAGMSL